MSLDIGIYVDPGTYQEEVIVANSLAIGQLPNLVAVIGIAPRVSVIQNETVRRGQIENEAVTFAGGSPHTYTTTDVATRRQGDTQLIKTTGNQNLTMPNSSYTWLPATLTGLVGPFAVIAGTFITLNMDGLGFISIEITANPAQTASVIAGNINTALAASSLYGAAYSAVATAVAGAVVLTSPSSAPGQIQNSDLRFLATPTATSSYAADGTTLIFGVVAPYVAPSTLQLVNSFYTGIDTFIIDYISDTTLTDPLANEPVTAISLVGNYANVTSYNANMDYSLSGNDVLWTDTTPATIAGLVGPYNTTTLTTLRLSFNGLAVLTVTLPSGATQSAASIAAAINAACIAQPVYGPLYGSVASVVGGAVVLTMPEPFIDMPLVQGFNSTVEFFSVPSNAVTTIFGIQLASLPFQNTGSLNRPVTGATYFVTYSYTRPTSAYNNPSSVTNLFFNPQDALSYTGALTELNYTDNTLGIATGIAFDNSAPQLLLIQVNDETSPGFPTINEVKAAIDSAANNESITDLIVLDTRLSVQVYLLNHCITQSSITEKNYRKGWYGMARNTPVGDIDTPNSFVFTAQVTLQVPPDSPGRGRSIITAPPNVSRDITFADGTDQVVPLDSTFLAVGCAALKSSFTSVATSLLKKSIVGFDLPSFQIYQKAERRILASNGVNVVTYTGGNLTLTDPVTTEQGAGGLREFSEISAMDQKDNAVREIDSVIDNNIIGIVPSNIGDFVNDIKGFISLGLQALINAGDIGPFVDSNGNVRDIQPQTDIQVYQSPTDPTKFIFRYFFMLRFPAKYAFGQYSVDSPFFGAGSSTATS